MKPYFEKDGIVIYHGDCREILASIERVDVCIADPPYAETSLAWDRWPDGWPALVQAGSLWCFGSFRMFLDRQHEFSSMAFAQEIVWEKHNGTNSFADRFRRVHDS